MKLSKEAKYLKYRDAILGTVIKEFLEVEQSGRTVFHSLISSIISQQISVGAARSIKQKFLNNFKGKFPTPQELLNISESDMRLSGISPQKIKYLKNLANYFGEKGFSENKFEKMDNEEVIADLVQIKGVGRWTVEMILMFTLNREDVFAYDDGGLKNAIYKLYKINPKKYKSANLKKKILKISESWAPYRTLACLYLWKYKDNKTGV